MISNPYVIILFLLLSAGYFIVEKVKEPIDAAIHAVEDGAKKTGHVLLHVVTLGKK